MRRLSLSLLIAVLASIVAAGWLMDRVFVRLDESGNDALNIALSLGDTLVQVINRSDPAHAAALASASETDYSVSLINVSDLGLPAELLDALKSGEPLVLESQINISLYFKLDSRDQVLLIRLPPTHSGNTNLRLLLTLLFYTLVAALLLVWLFPLINRLRRLAATAKLFGEGDLQQRIATTPESSLHDIETEFNRMAQRLQALVEDNRLLSGAVSHDLRTPLARLRFGIDALEEQLEGSIESASISSRVGEYLTRINVDLSAMEQLVAVLLEFARMDQQLSELPLSRVNLSTVVQDCVDSLAATTTRKVHLELPDNDAFILADERYTSMLLGNLVQNALKFSQQAIRISIVDTADPGLLAVESDYPKKNHRTAMSSVPGQHRLMVEDDGAGFGTSDIDRLVKPFERGDATNSDKTVKSYGLGLAIVARIAQWFGADLELGDSDALGGARVTVVFDGVE